MLSRTKIHRLVFVVLLAAMLSLGVAAQVREGRGRAVAGSNVTISAPVTQRPTPSIFTIPISVTDTTGQGVIAFQFNLSYNSSVIDPFGPNFGCSTSGTIAGDAGQGVTCNVQPDGTLRVAVSGANAMTGSGTVVNLTFRTESAAVPGNVSQLDLSAVSFYNNAGQISSSFSNGSVTLTSGPTASMVTVSGRLLSPDGRAIRAGSVQLTDNGGRTRTTSAGPRGEFRFEDVAAGQTYTLSAASRRFVFDPVAVCVTDEISSLDLIARLPH